MDEGSQTLGRGWNQVADRRLFWPILITKAKAAVRAAIVEPWSNGQTEGHINKLKMVKRQMYGQAKVDLLEARLIGEA